MIQFKQRKHCRVLQEHLKTYLKHVHNHMANSMITDTDQLNLLIVNQESKKSHLSKAYPKLLFDWEGYTNTSKVE